MVVVKKSCKDFLVWKGSSGRGSSVLQSELPGDPVMNEVLRLEIRLYAAG
jgi:hypothetical protein